ncbi:carbohydrate kinase family protein [bacterium]|nr:carbohydrate kinase family protein [bacterium]
MLQPHALVIGASNYDLKGRTHANHIPKTSNPGTIRDSAGGVARNIAENLARLGDRATLLSAVGNDTFGHKILETTGAAGVDISRIKITNECNTGTFLAILNHYGDLVSAIADLDAISLITVDYLEKNKEVFDTASFVILDADIPPESIEYSIAKCAERDIPICIEPVSVTRAKQIVPYLSSLAMITPNREEAEALVNFSLNSGEAVKEAGRVLVNKGIKWVIITLGPEGVLYATADDNEFLPSISTVVTDTVGAGDALTSGTINGLMSGLSLGDAVRRGIACANLTLQTRLSVSPDITLEKVKAMASSIFISR